MNNSKKRFYYSQVCQVMSSNHPKKKRNTWQQLTNANPLSFHSPFLLHKNARISDTLPRTIKVILVCVCVCSCVFLTYERKKTGFLYFSLYLFAYLCKRSMNKNRETKLVTIIESFYRVFLCLSLLFLLLLLTLLFRIYIIFYYRVFVTCCLFW